MPIRFGGNLTPQVAISIHLLILADCGSQVAMVAYKVPKPVASPLKSLAVWLSLGTRAA